MTDKGKNLKITPNLIPRACEGLNIDESTMSADEGAVLAKLDGLSSVAAICGSSGLGAGRTIEILNALHKNGLITFRDPEYPLPEGGQEGVVAEYYEAAYDLATLKEILKSPLPKGEGLVPIVDAIFVNLEHLSYYDLLSIGIRADQAQVKRAYLRATKVFHPDRFYRRADHEFKRKLQEIFKQLSKGYRALSDPEARRAYDDSLSGEQTLDLDREEVIEVTPLSSRIRTVKGESSPWKRVRVAKQKPVEERTKARKKEQEEEAPAKKGPKLKLGLKDGKVSRSPIMRQIQRMKKQAPQTNPNLEQAEKFYQGAMIEKSRGNINAARINLKLAIQYAPHDSKYQEALRDVEKQEDGIRAESEYKAGLDAQRDGDMKAAARHFRDALRMGFESAKLYHRLAEIMMEIERDYGRARALVLKAIEMEEGIAEYHMTLARAYKGMGQTAAAIQQLEKVVKLDPKNKLAVKEIKALKRG